MVLKSLFPSIALFMPFTAYAAFINPPSGSAGVVERQIQEEYDVQEVPPDKEIPLIEIEEPKEQLRFSEHIYIPVEKVEFEGNTVFSSEKLLEVIQECQKSQYCMEDIRALCNKIRAYYIQKGYLLTRVYAPAQDVKEGVLHLAVMEGKLGKVEVEGNKYYQSKFIEAYFSSMLGKPMHYDRLIKALLLLNENQDMHAGAIFKRGETQGTCDLLVRVYDQRPSHLYLNGNNYGSHLNTVTRTGGRFDWGNLIIDGDMLSVTGVLGSPIKHLRFADARYNFLISKPLGIRLNLSYLYADFVDPSIPSLRLKGRSQIESMRFDIPHLRTRRLNTDYYLAFDWKKVENFALSQTVSLDKLRILRVGTKLDYLDSLKGRNLFDFSFAQGIPHFMGGSGVVSSKPSRAGAGGQFSIGNVNYKRLQEMFWDMFLFFNVTGQYSPNKLPLAEQIYIGGVDTVRGFPSARGLGDYGYFLNLEWRVPLFGLANRQVPFSKRLWKDFLQIIGFLDNGITYLHGFPPTETHRVQMTSAGPGLRLKGPYNLSVNFDIGFPLSEQKKSSHAITYLKITWNPF